MEIQKYIDRHFEIYSLGSISDRSGHIGIRADGGYEF